MIESHYVLFVAWVSTYLIGIAISRNKEAEVGKKISKMLHIGKIAFFEVWGTQFPPSGLILGNVIGSHYDLIVEWVSTDFISIPISRN